MCVWDNVFLSHFICLNSSLLFRFYEYEDEATHSAHTQHLHAITQRYLYVFVAAQRNYRRPNTLQWASAHTITATTSSLSSSLSASRRCQRFIFIWKICMSVRQWRSPAAALSGRACCFNTPPMAHRCQSKFVLRLNVAQVYSYVCVCVSKKYKKLNKN